MEDSPKDHPSNIQLFSSPEHQNPLEKHDEKVLEIILDRDDEPNKSWKFNIQKIVSGDLEPISNYESSS